MPRSGLIMYSGNIGLVNIFVCSIGTSRQCACLVAVGTTRHISLSHVSREDFVYELEVFQSYIVLERFRFSRNIPSLLHQTSIRHSELVERERERNVLFNDTLNTFYLRLYGVRHMVKDHSDIEKGNPLPLHRLLLSINSKVSFICTIPQTG